ncbi:prophage antirepressor-like protein [Pseudomonas nitritireducens]|uniref:Prophage antirepressor-like protein n=1 Tax=Pseudomonas nitroreducens TaxID=46680 RepID=A0A7W7KKM6_PSENT|nr:BRO family protein [Pseudomonas nitritireducens]MBB4864069.1 prophage antirepressor-like protein [Pseudomonas nitritireducens]
MDALTATTFLRHNRPLRGVLIDNQPWFVACDFARLLGLHHPNVLAQRVEPHEVRHIRLLDHGGGEHRAEVLNEPALYKALLRFANPETRQLGRWLHEEVIPLLRDQHQNEGHYPRRLLMNWCARRVTLLDWQGELWVPWEQIPYFSEVKN